MQVLERPAFIVAAALLLCVGLCGASIASWQPIGDVPPYFAANGVVTFTLNTPGSDIVFLAGTATSTVVDPADVLVVSVNGVDVWNVSGASLMDKSSRLANITLPNAILPGTSTIIQWQLYDNSTLIDGPWSVTLEPMDAGNTVVVIIQTPGNGSFVIPLQTTVFCVFTTDFGGQPWYTYEVADAQGNSTYQCTIDATDVSEVSQFPISTPFLLSINATVYGSSIPGPVTISGPSVYINTTSYFLDADSFGAHEVAACTKTIWINATGNFYTNRFYSCAVGLSDAGLPYHQIVSAPAPPVNSSLVVCLFNTSSIILRKSQNGLPWPNDYTLTALVESTNSLANGTVVAGYYENSWTIESCTKTAPSHSVKFYILVIGGSGLGGGLLLAVLICCVFGRNADPAAQRLLPGNSVNA